MTEAKNPWLEERHFRRDAIRGSQKLLEAILTAQGFSFKRKPRRIYRPRQYGFESNPTVLRMQVEVATYFGLRPDLLYLSGRSRWYARPRQIVMYLAHTVGGVSLPRIGKHFNRDHTTVLHACRAVPTNDDLAADVAALRAILSPENLKTGDNSLRNGQEQAIEHSGNTQEERLAA